MCSSRIACAPFLPILTSWYTRSPWSSAHPRRKSTDGDSGPLAYRVLTVEENLRFAAGLWDLPGGAARAGTDELLRQFGLAERRDSPVRALSGGLRRAADIARGVLHRPRVLFLDEPTAGLDPRARRGFWQVLRDLRAASGVAVVLTAHYVEEAD